MITALSPVVLSHGPDGCIYVLIVETCGSFWAPSGRTPSAQGHHPLVRLWDRDATLTSLAGLSQLPAFCGFCFGAALGLGRGISGGGAPPPPPPLVAPPFQALLLGWEGLRLPRQG